VTTFLDEGGRLRCEQCKSRWGDHKLVYFTAADARSALERAAARSTYLRAYSDAACGYWHPSSAPARPPVPSPRRPAGVARGRPARVPRWLIAAGLVLLAWLAVVAGREALVDQARPQESPRAPDPAPPSALLPVRGASRRVSLRWRRPVTHRPGCWRHLRALPRASSSRPGSCSPHDPDHGAPGELRCCSSAATARRPRISYVYYETLTSRRTPVLNWLRPGDVLRLGAGVRH